MRDVAVDKMKQGDGYVCFGKKGNELMYYSHSVGDMHYFAKTKTDAKDGSKYGAPTQCRRYYRKDV